MKSILLFCALGVLAVPLSSSADKPPPEGDPCIGKGDCKKGQYCLPIKLGDKSYCVDKDKKCLQGLRWSKSAPESIRGQCFTAPVETFPHEGLDDKEINTKKR